MVTPRNSYDRDFCIRSVAALVMSLQDSGALAEDVIAALEAAALCEDRLRQHAAQELDGMLAQITPENLHPAIE